MAGSDGSGDVVDDSLALDERPVGLARWASLDALDAWASSSSLTGGGERRGSVVCFVGLVVFVATARASPSPSTSLSSLSDPYHSEGGPGETEPGTGADVGAGDNAVSTVDAAAWRACWVNPGWLSGNTFTWVGEASMDGVEEDGIGRIVTVEGKNNRTCGGDVLNARERKKEVGRNDRDDRTVLYDIGCVRLSPSHYT